MSTQLFPDPETFPTAEEVFTLRNAITSGKTAAVKKLLIRRPSLANKVDDVKDTNYTPLRLAIRSNDVDIVHALLAAGADPGINCVENDSNCIQSQPATCTPLHLSCIRNQPKIVLALLEYGADRHILDKDGKSAQDLAKSLNHNSIAKILANWTSPWDFLRDRGLRPEYTAPTDTKYIAMQQNALMQKERVFGKHHIGLVSTLERLGKVYETNGQLEQEIQVKSRILSLVSRTFDQTSPARCCALNNLGEAHFRNKDFSKALVLFKTAIQVDSLMRDKSDYQHPPQHTSCNLLENLAICSFRLKYFEEATEQLKDAIQFSTNLWQDSDHPSITQLLLFLAHSLFETNNVDESLQTAARALAIVDKHFGPTQEQIAFTLDHLGSLYYQTCQYVIAEAIFKRSLAIRETLHANHCEPSKVTETSDLHHPIEELLTRSRNNLAMTIAARRGRKNIRLAPRNSRKK